MKDQMVMNLVGLMLLLAIVVLCSWVAQATVEICCDICGALRAWSKRKELNAEEAMWQRVNGDSDQDR